ncbi:MAG: glycosyltransferase [Elusimicrobia bacterium]|nr:glycosyltransferase [Elusimicrobiota bacterium]
MERLYASVIVPTRDRPAELAECLKALSAQTLPQERFEVIVVDDGAAFDETCREVFCGGNLRVIRSSSRGPACARNAGASQARGALLVFTDDDCRPAARWLETLLEAAQKHPRTLFGGRTRNDLPENLFSEVSHELTEYLRLNDDLTPSNNMALPAEEYLALAGFGEGFAFPGGEDRDFSRRWLERGGQRRFVEEAEVLHAHALGPVSFAVQQFRYGRGACRHRREMARRQGRRMGLARPAFYFRLIRHVSGRSSAGPKLCRAALALLSQIFVTMGFVWEYGNAVRRQALVRKYGRPRLRSSCNIADGIPPRGKTPPPALSG